MYTIYIYTYRVVTKRKKQPNKKYQGREARIEERVRKCRTGRVVNLVVASDNEWEELGVGGIAARRVVKGAPYMGGNYRYIFKWKYHCSCTVPLEIIRIPNFDQMVPPLPFG